MRVLLVSTTLSFLPLPEGIESVETVASLDDVPDDLAAFDGVVADLRETADLERATAQLMTWGAKVPVVAIVRGARVAAGTGGVRFVDEAWLDASNEAVAVLLVRDVASADLEREIQRLRDRQAQLVHNEKFAAVGLLAAEIAHEINNPATFVITNLTVMMDYVSTIGTFHDDVRTHLATGVELDLKAFEALAERHEIQFLGEDLDSLLVRSLTGLNRIHQIVQDLKYFGADRSRAQNWVELDPLVHAAFGLVRHEARFRAELVLDLPPLPVVHSDANRLSQVILNVLVNAVQAIPAGAPSENAVTVTGVVSDETVVLSVSDTGSGIDAASLDRIFEPFFTTKAPGEGTGLGLAISRDIMRSLGGEIYARSEVGVGSTFDVVIPRGAPDE